MNSVIMWVCFGIFCILFNDGRHIVTRNEVRDPKKRMLMVCVQMFIEKGFKATTMLDSFDMEKTAKSVLDKLFAALEMNFDIKFNF